MRDDIHKLLPERKILEINSREKRALLPFIAQLSKSLFGTATQKDVQVLAEHIAALENEKQATFSHLENKDTRLALYADTMNERFRNILQPAKRSTTFTRDIADTIFQTQIPTTKHTTPSSDKS